MRVLPFIVLAAVVLAASFQALPSTKAQNATINVTSLDDAVANDDECSIREALANAADQATTHDDCEGGSVFNEVVLPEGAIVLAGGELTVEGAVTIRGQGVDATTVSGDGASRVFLVESGGSVAFEAMEIREGDATEGGGIYHALGELTVSDVRFDTNHADNAGGAIFSASEASLLAIIESEFLTNSSDSFGGALSSDAEGDPRTVSIVDSTFTGNTTPGGGGAVQARAGTMFIESSTFAENEAGSGGAIALRQVDLTMTGSSVVFNTASNSGGGITLSGQATLSNSHVRENVATSGGGIAVHAAAPATTLTIEDTSVSSNDATDHGAGIFFEEGTLLIKRSSVGSNRADNGGGGIWVAVPDGLTADVTLLDAALHNNVGMGSGGGGLVFHGTAGTGLLHVEGTTFRSNSAFTHSAMGLYGVTGTVVNSTFSMSPGTTVRVSDPNANVEFTNTTFVGDFPGFIVADILLHAIHDATVTVNNSVFVLAREDACLEENEGTISGSGNADDDGTCPGAIDVPGDTLSDLTNFVGPTFVHAPVAGSPLINAANNGVCPELDQRGRLRSDGACDIGAVEYWLTMVVPGITRD